MDNVLLKILSDILRTIICNLPRKFESHDVIDVLDQKYPAFYSALKEQYEGKGEERTADSVIAQMLGRDSNGFGIIKGELKDSENINGNVTPNHCWKKRED